MDKYQVSILANRQNLQRDRLIRLRSVKSIFGQPDLLTIIKVTTINSFLSHKKLYEKQQKFMFGLNFPTTAHLSSYINDRINIGKKSAKTQNQYKIRLYTYDIFRRIDYQIEINIPGCMEIKAYNLNGQPVNSNNVKYQSVYYSSVLRSLYPYYYHPNTQMHGQIQKFQVLQSFIKNFIPFAIQNDIQTPQDTEQYQNFLIEILIYYFKHNSFWNLSNLLAIELNKYMPERTFLLNLQLKQLKGQYKQIILLCAQQLIKQQCTVEIRSKLIQFQIRSLCRLRKLKQAKYLSQSIIRLGLDGLQTWQEILKLYFQENDDRYFFKLLNTAASFMGEEILLKDKIQKYVYPHQLYPYRQIQQKNKSMNQILNYPEFMMKFDFNYIRNQVKFKKIKQILEKSQKQKPTAEMIHRLEQSYDKQTFFQKITTLFQKQKGWNKLVQLRAQCFWLQNDYANYESLIKKKCSDKSYRFMNQSISEMQVSLNRSQQSQNKQQRKSTKNQQNIQTNLDKNQENQVPEGIDNSFQGQFSDNQSQDDRNLQVAAPCSKRIATKRVTRQISTKKIQFCKILCNYNLQKMFLIAYNNLKLHTDLQKWSSKLDFKAILELGKQKKQLLGYMFLNKGFFHKNMLRFRKSQQAFKAVRKICPFSTIDLISCYCLAKLYLQHNNIKGVQYYIIEVVRILYSHGIQKYNSVPYWAKQIIPYIIKYHGKGIIKRLDGPLKQLVQLWLQIDHRVKS